MVSIRRRRYLGLCSGKSSFPVVLPKPIEHNISVGNSNPHVNLNSVHPFPSVDASLAETEDKSTTFPGSSNAFESSMSMEEPKNYSPGKEIKCRKRHRKRHHEDQKPCIMRGVYFKNMKWQAAIKVDKKQIHLGTVGSQEEAARLYDRAAFMCGREPNFGLSDREKEELRQFDWEEFLALTRSTINNKKHQRKFSTVGQQNKLETKTTDSNWELGGGARQSSISDDDDDVDSDTPVS
ncbi:ethylene-responsive transcription factor-like protein At4g13040 [Zingiber officinale]|uniref:AP2/ERF domain-containing protein n=1 Tax=Zingiber officinale TaxID=94328 RepID=A0A8J5HES2_ZINOF|nr:ethylene-responsive transcription factor-like protein At4g13040 [Zingiber officinale]XP_042462639.1 ethylene-responsive transcription factor-like protein At4g13040 [Zingiber officinale]XP_042462640.1 ethylene-responsive transcription factor-like protein At4g13040 [Zingiber officinale]XP_042462641.1 ethylene-responsive transcription factor-like protein At4g13040 [Zingiber officinale]XP_042462642.1 ethylene-responsive transcription factor-like protein At4g13040 [Zingiber officinale]KAG6524600